MHKRYRRAVQKMLSWYKAHGDAEASKVSTKEGTSTEHDGDDPGPETVLILVSHGAGCNAIIGGLTDRTVLLDVGMASLTMAVRKDAAAAHSSVEALNGNDPNDPRNFLRRKSSVTIPVSEDYEIKLMASTDHLRPNGNTLNPPPLASSQSYTAGATNRTRSGVRTNSMDEIFTIGEPRHSTTSSAIGSIRRTASNRSVSPLAPRQPFATSPVTSSFSGLWNRPAASDTAEEEYGPGDDMVLNFGDSSSGASAAPSKTESGKAKASTDEKLKSTPPPIPTSSTSSSSSSSKTEGHRGLWGSSAVAEERKERDDALMPKRRWTVHERAR